jgi:hypothetical protein
MAKVRRRAADWATLIDEWRRGGLSLPAFCQRHGLSRGTMQNWVYKPALKRAVEDARNQVRPTDTPRPGLAALPEPLPSFLPIRVAEVPAASPAQDRAGIEVVLRAGRRIVVGSGFDPETLRRVVAVLEDRPC